MLGASDKVWAPRVMCLFGGLVRNIYPAKVGDGAKPECQHGWRYRRIGATIGAWILALASLALDFLINLGVHPGIFRIRFLPDVPRSDGRSTW